jgi:hypothetical protein
MLKPFPVIALISSLCISMTIAPATTFAYTKLTNKQISYLSTSCKFKIQENQRICKTDYGLRVKNPVNIYKLENSKWIQDGFLEPMYYEDIPKKYGGDGSLIHQAIPATRFDLVKTPPTYMKGSRMILVLLNVAYGGSQNQLHWIKVRDVIGLVSFK